MDLIPLTLALSPPLKEFIDSQVSTGQYRSPDEYVLALVENAQRNHHGPLSDEPPVCAEQQLRNVLDSVFAFVGILTTDGTLIEVNRSALEAAGIRKDDTVGRPFQDAYWWSYSPAVQRQLQDTIARAQRGESSRYEVDVRLKHGHLMTIDFMLTPVRDQQGCIAQLIASGVPIAERRQAEQALARQLSLTRAITDNATTALFIMDDKQQCVFMNPAAEKLTGFSIDEVRGRALHQIVHHTRPDGSPYPLSECPIDRAFPEHNQTQGEEVFVHKDGHFYQVSFTASPMREGSGIVGTVIEVQDITERKRKESERDRTERLLDAVLDALPVSIIIGGEDGRVVRMNLASLRIWGQTPPMSENVASYREWVGYWPGTEKMVEPHEWPLSRAVLRGENTTDERIEVARFGTGERRILELSAAPVRDENGSILGGVVAAMDVTDRVHAEQAVRASEATLSAVLDAMPVGVTIADSDGNILRDNEAHRELWGLPREATPKIHYAERIGFWPDAGRRIEPQEWAVARAIFNGEVIRGELVECEQFGTGRHRFYLNNAAPIRDAKGRIIAAVSAEMDITGRKRAEEALRRSEEEFRTLANGIPQLCWMADADGHIFWYNRRWYEYTGTTFEQMEGWGWQRVHDPQILPDVVERWVEALRTGEPFDMVFPLRGADGMFRPFLTRVMPVRDETGRATRWFGTNTDISEQKRVESELRHANHDLEQFAFSASHDLQEPLRNVAIYSQLINRQYGSRLDEQGRDFLGYLVEGAQRMSQLVSDLLAYTQAASLGAEPVAPVSAEQVLREVLDSLHRSIQESRASVTHDALPPVAIKSAHLHQLFQNVIGNALKYRGETAPPRVHISVQRQDGFWRFSVQDNGIGIEPEFHDRIFGLFKRLHGRDAKYPGTGIGLAICQKIVERHGGRIWVESLLGEGTTFHFTLPAAGDK